MQLEVIEQHIPFSYSLQMSIYWIVMFSSCKDNNILASMSERWLLLGTHYKIDTFK